MIVICSPLLHECSFDLFSLSRGTQWQWIEALRYSATSRFDSPWRHCSFSLTTFSGTGDASACNRNEYQEYFLESKVGRCVEHLTTFHVPIVLKSGSLYLLEPTGPVLACNGIAIFSVSRVLELPLLPQDFVSWFIFQCHNVDPIVAMAQRRNKTEMKPQNIPVIKNFE
jgi:hypothetical protein